MKIMSNREYWIWTEVFVHLHEGQDYCQTRMDGRDCRHCMWMEKVFDRPAPRVKTWTWRLRTNR